MLGALASAGVILVGGLGGSAGLVGLVSGTLLLDVAMQSGMVANQVRIYALRPEILGRLNTAYMAGAFLGGGLGSRLGTPAHARLVASLCALALARHLLHLRRPRDTTPQRHHLKEATMEICEYTEADWPSVWPIFREVVSAGETFA